MISQKELDQRRTNLIPTWASLRSIGNSRAVQASVAFPVIGYLVLLSSQFTSFFDGGLIGDVKHHRDADWWNRMWSLKLYFVYFGLLFLGIGPRSSSPPYGQWFACNSILVAIMVLPIAGLPASRGCQADQASKLTIGSGRDMSERCRDRPRTRNKEPNSRIGNQNDSDCDQCSYSPPQLSSAVMARRYRTETTL
jgi:hypothetical protein